MTLLWIIHKKLDLYQWFQLSHREIFTSPSTSQRSVQYNATTDFEKGFHNRSKWLHRLMDCQRISDAGCTVHKAVRSARTSKGQLSVGRTIQDGMIRVCYSHVKIISTWSTCHLPLLHLFNRFFRMHHLTKAWKTSMSPFILRLLSQDPSILLM